MGLSGVGSGSVLESAPGQLSFISLDVIYSFLFFSFSLAIQQAYKILVPQPGIEPVPPAVEVQRLSY